MKIKEIKKIPLFRMAFKLSAGLILGKRAAVFLCNAFMYFDELLVDHMQKHRYDNNEVGNAYNKALNIAIKQKTSLVLVDKRGFFRGRG